MLTTLSALNRGKSGGGWYSWRAAYTVNATSSYVLLGNALEGLPRDSK